MKTAKTFLYVLSYMNDYKIVPHVLFRRLQQDKTQFVLRMSFHLQTIFARNISAILKFFFSFSAPGVSASCEQTPVQTSQHLKTL